MGLLAGQSAGTPEGRTVVAGAGTVVATVVATVVSGAAVVTGAAVVVGAVSATTDDVELGGVVSAAALVDCVEELFAPTADVAVCAFCTAGFGATVAAGLDFRLTVVTVWAEEFGLFVFGAGAPESTGAARITVESAPSALAVMVAGLETTTT